MDTVDSAIRNLVEVVRQSYADGFEELWEAIDYMRYQIDSQLEPTECEPPAIAVNDRGSKLEAELQMLVRLYDNACWARLAEKYNAFGLAVDKDEDFFPVRLNVAELLDEILRKHSTTWERDRG